MFNSISKRFKNEPPQAQQQTKNDQEMEGFICPVCMASFNSPDLVQKHFDSSHNDIDSKAADVLSPSVGRKESIQNIQENLNDLKQSLDEEIWFNKELQKECERLQELIQDRDDEIKIKTEAIDKHGSVVLELENCRDTLTSELKSMTQSRDELISDNETLRLAREECAAKMEELASSEHQLRDVIERQQRERDTLSDQLTALMSSVDSSNCQSAEFAAVTERCEASEKIASQLQLQIDSLTAEREQIVAEWSRQCSLLRDKVVTCESERIELLANHERRILELDGRIESCKTENLQLQGDIELAKRALMEKEDKMVVMQRSWATDQSTLESTLRKLEDTDSERQKVKLLNQELGVKIKSLDSDMMQLRNANNNKDEEIKNALKSNKNLSEELNEVKQLLETEKTDKNVLQSQVEMTDAANIVMEQLQSEKKSLQENILHLKKQLENETERNDLEISALRSEIQSEKEQVFNINSSVVEKDEQIEEALKHNSEMKQSIEKLKTKLELETSKTLQLEDRIVALTRDLKVREDSLSTFHTNYNELKEEFEKSVHKSEKAEENLRRELANLNSQLESAKIKDETIGILEKEIELKDANTQSLEKDLVVKKGELDRLSTSLSDMQKEKQEILERESRNIEVMSDLKGTVSKQESTIDDQCLEISESASKIEKLTQQIASDAKLISDRSNQLSQCEHRIVELEGQIKEGNAKAQNFLEEIEVQEIKKKKLTEDNLSLKSQIETTKRDLLEKESLVTSMVAKQEILEKTSTEISHKLKVLQDEYDKAQKEKLDLNNQFTLCKIEVDNLQELYSDSVKLQNEYQSKLDTVTADHAKTVKCLKNLEEQQKTSQLEYSKELDHLKKENLELKNHVKALTKTLNESSENYKQERLEAADKEFSLKSQNESLQADLENLTKSLQRTEEDLETEKNLRESERNNMTEKISQLSEQVVALERLKEENEQKLEVFESDNIEQKLRLELVHEEKDKLLEKIIQLENSLKKQNDLYSKKCRELDQLQSAILDLGRENQSLQISKEKLTNRQWIGDVDAVDCHTCHKPFSLTLRKHHCRNCGQVYCQDCSSKAASLAMSRNPVRVCDACYIEVQSHRRNSSVSSTNVSLQM